MKISNGKKVEVHYTLRADGPEGEIEEQTTAEEPLSFIFGSDSMLPKFEAALHGLSAGEKFTIFIPCAEAYGDESDEHLLEFPKSEFIGDDGEMDEELFEVGEVVPMSTPDGNTIYGVMTEIKLNTVIIDFNHPMAGDDLYFEGEVLSVSEG
ncbi:MAG: FKBP-type peptidyl-prolyl cis-trans isomerase [Flavobacteriales bacterium]|nr:FKBP-type peptidyl-prolyl cis-trans isomerase [Flavobacteriales bacterium]